jgi:hypothetical protein
MSAMMDWWSFNKKSTTTTMTGVRQSQIELAAEWIESSQMDLVELNHALHACIGTWCGASATLQNI